MTGLLDSPYLGMGMGLLAAAQPQPPGQNRYSILMGAMNQANQQRMQSQLFKMRIEESERKKKERTGKQEALSSLLGGLQQNDWVAQQGLGQAGVDPKTGIDWNTQRQPSVMSRGEMMSLAGKADPEGVSKGITEQLFPAQQKQSISPKKVKDKNSPTGWSWLSVTGDRMPGAPPPTGGQEITFNEGGSIKRIGPMTPAQAGKKTSEALGEIERNQANIAEVSKVLRKLDKTPSAAGIPGYLIENLGGLIEQAPLFGEQAGKWLGTAEVQSIRTDMISLIGRFIAPITGDESGRYSDKDLALVQLAERGMDPLASKNVVVAAMNAIRDISYAEQARGRMKLDGIPDLTGEIGRQAYGDQLLAQGMSEEEAIKALREALKNYNIPEAYWLE